MAFQVANVNKALESVAKMVRNGNRVVFDASGSYVENKMKNDMLWLRERDGVLVVDVVAPPETRERGRGGGKPSLGRRSMWRGFDVQMTQQRDMACGTEELHAMEENMDEDKVEPGNEEDENEEQEEEEHQKARAIAGLT